MQTRRPVSVTLVLALLGSLLLWGCKSEDSPVARSGTITPDQDAPQRPARVVSWDTHIAEKPQSLVGVDETLRLRFSHPVIKRDKLNEPLTGIVRMTTGQDVVAVFTAEDTLEVRHPAPFPSGREVELELRPEGLDNLPEGLPPAYFLIKVIQQDITLRETGLTNDARNPDGMHLDGMLETADKADPKAVEGVLTARQGERPLSIRWTHHDDKRHAFSVTGIQRQSTASLLTLTWDGSPVQAGARGERQIEVPAAEVFAFVSMRAVQSPDTYVEVRFSDALDATQNFAGLARINGNDARVQVDGNALRLYGSQPLTDEVRVSVDGALRSAKGKTLAKAHAGSVTFMPVLPAVRFADRGNILPSSGQLSIPVEAVATHSVELRAFEIFPDNIGQYLQASSIDWEGGIYSVNYAHRDVGRYLWQKTIKLPHVPTHGWERFDLDVSDLMREKKGSLLRLQVSLLPQHSAYSCAVTPPASTKTELEKLNYDGFDREDPTPSALSHYFASARYYSWSKREDPCSAAYFSHGENTAASQVFFASNIGLLAKQGGDRDLHVLVTDLRTAMPLPDAEITAFNFQRQVIGKATSDPNGLAVMAVEGVPFYVEAAKDDDKGYLRVPRNNALPTSQFDTGGTRPEGGLKGFFYGERDIWRPGDDIFLTFILLDRDKTLPAHYPVTLEFFDTRGSKVRSITNASPTGGFYTFRLNTEDNAPTGNWRAIIRIGDHFFDKVVKIENIAPNRLKLNLDLPEKGLSRADMPRTSTLDARWLNGATAAKLKADVQLRLSATQTRFEGLDGYRFDDHARSFTQEPETIFEGTLDDKGVAPLTLDIRPDSPAPGALHGVFTLRVFEPGGQYSSQYRSTTIYPYDTFIGIHAPKGNSQWGNALDKDADHAFELISVDADGKPKAKRFLDITVFSVEWRWWWEDGNDDLSRYASESWRKPVKTAALQTDDSGHAQWTLNGKDFEWGRYLVRVCDSEKPGFQGVARDKGKHCTSEDIYLGWGYGDKASRDVSTRLSLTTDKERYSVGDMASIRLPEGPDRQVMVSLENGNRVLTRYWAPVKASDNTLAIPVTAPMAPNVYVHITQLQPHQGRNNDLPLRTYGIVPLLVEDPATHLQPVINVADKARPESTLDIAISETSGRPMTYTLAVVDEGLLGVTGYRTPDPHDTFYRREALGVLTWDLFDMVVGAYGADLARRLAIGGSDSIKNRDSNRERRFPPVVRFFGPFQLAEGETRTQSLALPPYMGAVRVMVVAGDGRAFGKAEKSVTITQPLTVLSTLPRVLGPGEEIDLPVTVFVSDAPFGTATVRAMTDDLFTLLDSEATADFPAPGEQTINLRLRVNDGIGIGKVRIEASLGDESAREVVHIPVRTPNLPSVRSEHVVVKPGDTWTPSLVPHGLAGTNTTTLSISRAPDFGLEKRLDYLVHYPHGCIEQTTSAAFPQIYLSGLVTLNDSRTREIEANVTAAIARLRSFQTESGGFGYWPHDTAVSDWGNHYAGHFLLEARRAGYDVPSELLDPWLAYQKQQARSSEPGTTDNPELADQAYRLYTLVLAGQADMGAMNRLRDALGKIPAGVAQTSRRLLALAYFQTGLADLGQELLEAAGNAYTPSRYADWYYGSALREQAIQLLAQSSAGDKAGAWALGEDVARSLASDEWYSTQSTAWALQAISRTFSDAISGETRFSLKDTGDWRSLASARTTWQDSLTGFQAGSMSIRNDGTTALHATLSHRGVPANAEEQPVSAGLAMQVRYTDVSGQPLSVDTLTQGQDFIAELTIANTSRKNLENLSLTQGVASGWQIRNTRLEGAVERNDMDYQDIRDDRVLSYFPLSAAAEKGNSEWPEWRYEWRSRQIKDSLTVRILLNASFAGRFYLPGWQAEAMYDGKIKAATAGRWVEVVRP